MVEIKSFGSSSAGNCYQIIDGSSSLLLEAGISPKKLPIDFSTVDALLVTHEHGDHSKFIKDILKRSALSVYCTKGTAQFIDAPNYRIMTVKAKESFTVKGWQIMPFEVEHDAAEPVGYFILTPSGKKVLFATDTYYIRYKFKGITHFMIECNYSLDKVDELLADGKIDKNRRNRLVTSHFEINNVLQFFRDQDKSAVEEIWLLHLSDSNSDARLFKEKVQAATGAPVYVAGGLS